MKSKIKVNTTVIILVKIKKCKLNKNQICLYLWNKFQYLKNKMKLINEYVIYLIHDIYLLNIYPLRKFFLFQSVTKNN